MQRRLPPLNAIRAFEAVARHQHLGRAADELHVTHSAVSQQVKQLEEWFGRALFLREKGRLVLKSEGKELLRGYSEALDILHDTSEKLVTSEDDLELTVHCDPAFFKRVVMRRRENLNMAARGVTIDLVTSSKPGDSFPEDADVVIDLARHKGWRNVHWEHLLDLQEFPACSPALLEKYDRPERPWDIRNLPLLHGFNRNSWNSWLVEHAGTTSAGCKNSFYDDFNLTIDSALAGGGVIMADPILCYDELKDGRLVQLFPQTVREVSYYAFCSSPKYGTTKVRRVFDALINEVHIVEKQLRSSLES